MASVSGERRGPRPSSDTVSRTMQRMGRKDTAPEIALRRELTSLGLRYRIHRRDLPGRPDVAFGPARVAVFVDGCFWHGCPEHAVMPKANQQWWAEKLDANKARDTAKDTALRELGWEPVHVWEHEDHTRCLGRAGGALRGRGPAPRRRSAHPSAVARHSRVDGNDG